MKLHKGDHILVNLAPIIGSNRRSRGSIPCTVLALDDQRIQVSPEYPYRHFSLWVATKWIDRKAGASAI